jgi:hypothetical protein
LCRTNGDSTSGLDRRGLGDDDVGTAEDPWADASPVLAGLAAASVHRIVATGPSRGPPVRRFGEAPETLCDTIRDPHCQLEGTHGGFIVNGTVRLK